MSSTAIVPINQNTAIQAAGWESKIDLIKRNVAKGATDDELQIFLHQCRKTGLDPLAKQIYFQKRKNWKTGEEQMTIITGIDGYRLVADRTGKYAGNDDPEFDDYEKIPKWAKVTVYKMVDGQRCPFTATARWSQYFPGEKLGFMWNKMPHLMLGKCAEALALRKAFPAELSGVYTAEEMHQADRQSGSAPAIHEGEEYPACEECSEAIIGVKLPDGRELKWSEVYAKSKADHEGRGYCAPCQIKKHKEHKQIVSDEPLKAEHPMVAEMRERVLNADPDPMFSLDAMGKPVVAGTVTQVSITAKSFQLHFGKERLSTFPNRSICEHLKGTKGQKVILEYELSGDGKYKNITNIRKIGDREFVDNVPAYQLNEDPDPVPADLKQNAMSIPDGEELPF